MYVLVDFTEGKKTEIKAACYTEALVKALEYKKCKVEATDPEEQQEILSREIEGLPKVRVDLSTGLGKAVLLTTFSTDKNNMNKEIGSEFTYKNLEIFKMVSQKPCTISEICEKTGVRPATATTAVRSLFKRNGYSIIISSMPGIDELLYFCKGKT